MLASLQYATQTRQGTDMTRKTLTALSVVLTLAASAAPAFALNPQPLPPKESRYGAWIVRHRINVLNAQALRSKILLNKSVVVGR